MAFTNKQFQDMLREGIKLNADERRAARRERQEDYQKGLDDERAARAAARPKPEKKGIPVKAVGELEFGTKRKIPEPRIHDEEEAKDWFKRKTDSKVHDGTEWVKNKERDELLYGFYGSDQPIAIARLALDPDEGYYFYYRIPDLG